MKKKPSATAPELIPPQIVADIGRAVFGPIWQQPLAQALKVHEQAVRRWTNDGCPSSYEIQLRAMLEARADAIHQALGTLKEFEGAEIS